MVGLQTSVETELLGFALENRKPSPATLTPMPDRNHNSEERTKSVKMQEVAFHPMTGSRSVEKTKTRLCVHMWIPLHRLRFQPPAIVRPKHAPQRSAQSDAVGVAENSLQLLMDRGEHF